MSERLKRLRRSVPAVCALLGAACAVLPMSAQAAIVRPKLTTTNIFQASREMSVGVSLKIPKADSTVPAKATLCVLGKCKTEVITKTGLPASAAQATTYSPNVLFKLDELNRKVTVRTTLIIGGQRYVYTSSAKDVKARAG